MTSPLSNFRDLGGHATPLGRVMAGVLFRSDDVSTISPPGVNYLTDRGIWHIVDLRSSHELALTGRGPMEPHSTHHHLPLALPAANTAGQALAQSGQPLTQADVARWYYEVTLESLPTLVRGVELISALDRAAVVHCAAGKDRTGIFIAAILSLLNVAERDITADYAASNDNLPQVYQRLRMAPYGFVLDNLPGAGALLDARPGVMEHYLRLINQHHSSMLHLLLRHGLQHSTVQALQARLSR